MSIPLLCRPPPCRRRAPSSATPARAFHIDRRQHLDIAWHRQEAQEERVAQQSSELQGGGPSGAVIAVESLQQLETLVEAAGSSVVVVFFYSKSCGSCKSARKQFQELAQEAKSQRARVAFLEHNVFDDYDAASDVARFYKVKAVPCFIFLDEGAVVRRLYLRDIRALAGSPYMAGSPDMIHSAMAEDLKKLKRTLWQVILRCAPSAR